MELIYSQLTEENAVTFQIQLHLTQISYRKVEKAREAEKTGERRKAVSNHKFKKTQGEKKELFNKLHEAEHVMNVSALTLPEIGLQKSAQLTSWSDLTHSVLRGWLLHLK